MLSQAEQIAIYGLMCATFFIVYTGTCHFINKKPIVRDAVVIFLFLFYLLMGRFILNKTLEWIDHDVYYQPTVYQCT